MEYLPAFLLNFMLPNAQSATVREGVDEHFHAVDLLRSPDAPFERVFTFRFENASLPVYPLSAAGRMIVLEPIGDPARKALTDALTAVAHMRHNIGEAADRPLPAFPVTVARAFPSHLAHNVEVPKDVHVLTDAEADLLRLAAVEIADLLELLIRLRQLLTASFRFYKDRVGVDRLIIADAGNIDAQRGKAPTGRQERADVVGHRCDIGLFHAFARSLTTSPATIRPTAAAAKALLPGTCRRCVHLRAVPGGQMQCVRQLMDMSSSGVMGGSLE